MQSTTRDIHPRHQLPGVLILALSIYIHSFVITELYGETIPSRKSLFPGLIPAMPFLEPLQPVCVDAAFLQVINCHHAIELRKNSAAPNLSLSVFEKKRRHYSSQYSLSFCPVFPEALQPFYTGFRTVRFIHDWHFCRFTHHLLLLF